MPVKKFAMIWNSLWPIELEDVKVKEYCSCFDILISYFMHRFLKDFILFANFGRSTVILTRRPVPATFKNQFNLLQQIVSVIPIFCGFKVRYPSFSRFENFSCFWRIETKDWRRPTAARTFPLFSKDLIVKCSEWLTQTTMSLFFVWKIARPMGQCCLYAKDKT